MTTLHQKKAATITRNEKQASGIFLQRCARSRCQTTVSCKRVVWHLRYLPIGPIGVTGMTLPTDGRRVVSPSDATRPHLTTQSRVSDCWEEVVTSPDPHPTDTSHPQVTCWWCHPTSGRYTVQPPDPDRGSAAVRRGVRGSGGGGPPPRADQRFWHLGPPETPKSAKSAKKGVLWAP